MHVQSNYILDFYHVYVYIFNLRTIIYCFNLLMIIPTLQKNTITEIIYLRNPPISPPGYWDTLWKNDDAPQLKQTRPVSDNSYFPKEIK